MSKRIVSLEYEIRVEKGDVLESSAQRGPLRFVAGSGQLLPALEKLVEKLEPGKETSGVLQAKDAFGDEKTAPTKEIARKEFPADAKIAVGQTFEAGAAGGQRVVLKVYEVTKDVVKVRLMHPLHDKNIAYKIKVLSVERSDRPPAIPTAALDLEEVKD
jgi:FKBP-type peptidyl-prolyl cis-trans isomerase 2